MILIIQRKFYVICTYIFGILVCKFSLEQDFCILVLLLINKNSKISFYYDILILSLAIYLRIKSKPKLLFYAKKII